MIVTLTDFNEPYLAMLHGSIRKHTNAEILTYVTSITKKSASWLLQQYHTFPKGTVFLCVVCADTTSQAIILRVEDYYFIAPNNGVLYEVAKKREEVVSVGKIKWKEYGELAGKFYERRDLLLFGKKTKLTKLEVRSTGEVVYIDSFHNIITNIPAKKNTYTYKRKKYRCYERYQDAKEPVFLIKGDFGTLEFSGKTKQLGLHVGDKVKLQ